MSMYLSLGASLALAGFFVLNACLSVGSYLVFQFIVRLVAARPTSPAPQRARLFFMLKVLPAAVAALCALLLVIPSYLMLEPRGTSESLSWLVLLFATFALCLLTYGALKATVSWRANRAILGEWLSRAEPVALPGIGMPAYRLMKRNSEDDFPVIAVIGAFRPRLFVSEQVFEALSPEELAAALQHEMGHLAARDNLKRLVARSSPGLTSFLPGAEKLARLWHTASEECADVYAVQQGNASPLALASALIRVSRMIPSGCPAAVPAGAYFLEGGDLPDVAQRVHLLLVAAESPNTATVSRNPARRMLLSGILASSLLLLTALYPTMLTVVHELLEKFLHLVG